MPGAVTLLIVAAKIAPVSDPLTALQDAAADLEAAREAAEEYDDAETVATAYRDVYSILERYEERATDWDDFEGYIRFREALGERLSELPEDVPEREAFAAADAKLATSPRNPPSEADFERARELLAPAREYADALEEREAARERYEEAYAELRDYREDLKAEVERLETLAERAAVDFDAPTERIREPIESYDGTVRDAFEAFRRDAPAREVLGVISRTESYPLVNYESPPETLVEYLRDADAGEQPIPELLDAAGRSRASLAHDVDDPGTFKTVVGSNRTYLERLDAEPLTVGWPPPSAGVLRWRAAELVAVVGRFAPESVVSEARTLRSLADREEYERLRRAAVARAETDEAERERLRSGSVEAELADARDRLAEVEAALSSERAD